MSGSKSSSKQALPFDEQTLLAERNRLLSEMDAKFLSEGCETQIGLSDSVLRSRLAFEVHEEKTRVDPKPVFDDYKRENIYTLLQKAHNDPLVWTKLEKLCDKFLRETAANKSAAMSVLLSIL